MQRDHRLGFPAALLADIPAEKAARYPLGRPTRDPEPQTWPFPLVKPAVTFVADSRTMDSDRPQPVVLGVDMGKPEKPAHAEPQADAEGWVEHDGGRCPEAVAAARKNGQKVLVRFRSGEVNEVKSVDRSALDLVFKPLPSDESLDVLAYRVVPA